MRLPHEHDVVLDHDDCRQSGLSPRDNSSDLAIVANVAPGSSISFRANAGFFHPAAPQIDGCIGANSIIVK